MNIDECVITFSRLERIEILWEGVSVACREAGVSRVDPRIMWAIMRAMWSAA